MLIGVNIFDVVPTILGKKIQKKRFLACLKSEQRSPAPALSLARHGDPFLEQARPEVGIDQPFIHLSHCLANMGVCQTLAYSQTNELL